MWKIPQHHLLTQAPFPLRLVVQAAVLVCHNWSYVKTSTSVHFAPAYPTV